MKILANFYFARDNTKTPLFVSSFIVFLNVTISLSFFNAIGFLIIPIATSISTWFGVFVYFYLLTKNKLLFLQKKLIKNIFKIIASSALMCAVLLLSLQKYASYLDYSNIYKSIFLIIIVCFAGIVYLISCYLFGLLKIKNYKAD